MEYKKGDKQMIYGHLLTLARLEGKEYKKERKVFNNNSVDYVWRLLNLIEILEGKLNEKTN